MNQPSILETIESILDGDADAETMNTFDRLKHLATLSDATTLAVDITAVEARQLLALTPSSERDEFVDEALDLRTYAMGLGFATVEDAREALKLAVDVKALDEWAMRVGRPVMTGGYDGGCKVVLSGAGESFYGSTPDAARRPAADWARGQKP